jgi:L-aspartate oxidase
MEIKSDYLIIGSGIAGLSLALKIARYGTVAVVTKKERIDTNTNLAQGGIASVMDATDSFENHVRDTLEAGDGLCNEEVVRMVVENGPARIKELLEIGVEFTEEDGELHLGMEGGHSHRRIVHARDLTGAEVERALLKACDKVSNIKFYEHHFAVDLITTSKLGIKNDTRCLGAYVLDVKKSEVHTFLARATVLATGGCGKVYRYTTNPDIATGDGVALAYRAGAEIANMEFFQFHPTCLYHPKAKRFLISEAVRGEGAILRRIDGTRFMPKYHPQAELAPRDIVARAIDAEMKKRGDDYVLLDISHKGKEFVKEHFPNIYETCLKYGYDMGEDLSLSCLQRITPAEESKWTSTAPPT